MAWADINIPEQTDSEPYTNDFIAPTFLLTGQEVPRVPALRTQSQTELGVDVLYSSVTSVCIPKFRLFGAPPQAD